MSSKSIFSCSLEITSILGYNEVNFFEPIYKHVISISNIHKLISEELSFNYIPNGFTYKFNSIVGLLV